MLIDSHCHLDGFSKKGELEGVLARSREAGVTAWITIGTELDDWDLYAELAEQYPKLWYTVGLHPGHVDEGWEAQVREVERFWGQLNKPVALGEIGLDYFRLPKKDADRAAKIVAMQKAAFDSQLAIARKLEVPIVVHCRDAFEDCLACIDASGFPWERVVYHCFSGGAPEITPILERGGRASFTGIVTYKSAPEVREALRLQGPEKLMLETDCPYLSPEPKRGKPNEPAYMAHTAAFVAGELGLTLDGVAETTAANTEQFFGLEG